MKDQASVEKMLAVMTNLRRTTRAPDLVDGAIDALGWVLADTEEDTPPTMLAWQLMVSEPDQKERT